MVLIRRNKDVQGILLWISLFCLINLVWKDEEDGFFDICDCSCV